MTNFNEAEHPRAAAGQFTEKTQNTPEVVLDVASSSAARQRLETASEEARQANDRVREAAVVVLREELRQEFPTAKTALFFRPYDAYTPRLHLSVVLDGDGNTLFDTDEGDYSNGDYDWILENFAEDSTGLDEPTDSDFQESPHGVYRELTLTAPEVTA